MTVYKIISKRTGIGNRIQFLPVVKYLENKGDDVFSDDEVLDQLGICRYNNKKADIYLIAFGYNWKKFWIERFKHNGRFIGFTYRIKKKHFGIGYSKAFRFNNEIPEIYNNGRLIGLDSETALSLYKLDGWNPVPGRVALLINDFLTKRGKSMRNEIWQGLIVLLKEKGFDPINLDHDAKAGVYHKTPSIKALKDILATCSYYISTDNGPMHVADALGIPGVVVFGATHINKNRPRVIKSKVITKNLDCSPCFNWGRINCDKDYKCMEIGAKAIFEEFLKLTTNA